jgi:aryl-alcohol dehydrogenase-like predicted oxidoreductase
LLGDIKSRDLKKDSTFSSLSLPTLAATPCVNLDIFATPDQVLIRWAIEKGYSCLPKSQDPSRIEENFNVFDFSLSDEDIALLDSIHSNSI